MTEKERRAWYNDEKNWYVQDRTSDGTVRLLRLILKEKGPTICRLDVTEEVLDWERTYKEGREIYRSEPVTKQVYAVKRSETGEPMFEPISKTQALNLMRSVEE